MQALWYAIVVLMLSTYIVLDGFDFGVGIIHLFVGRNCEERKPALAAIGPFWTGNEVWLVAAGGVLFFAFPKVYAAGFSGFYLPLMMVLWLLIVRGLSLEFRSREDSLLWQTFWDTAFSIASLIMAFVFGAALANVIRGVPVDESGYFSGPLFTNFMPGKNPGVLDWYTMSVGVFACLTLAGHGALYLNWKTEGKLKMTSKQLAPNLWIAVILWGIFVTLATHFIAPHIRQSLLEHSWTWVFAGMNVVGLAAVVLGLAKNKDLVAFLGSSLFIFGLLFATASGMFPAMLVSTIDPAYTITVYSGALSTRGLESGLYWWIPAMILVLLYFANLFWTFRHKVSEADSYEH